MGFALLLLAAALGVSSTVASAAPPGALRIDRGRFTVIHYPVDAALARSALDAAVTRDSFPFLPRSSSRIVIMIAPDAATFREWAGRADFPWAAALAFVEQRRVVMQGRSANSDAGSPLQVLRHELAHIALHDHLGGRPPRWFEEGYASYAAGEERTDNFLSANAALVFRGMPSLASLDTLLSSTRGTDARAGYALALRAVADLAAVDQERGLEPLFAAWLERGSFDLAMRRAYAQTADDFERDWRRRTRWQFAFLAVAVNSAMGGLVLVAMLVPLHRSRRRRQQERLAEMRRREAITEAAMRSAALDDMLQAIGPATPSSSRGPDA
ncbi:MAG: hypothetical protein V4813_08350 [Gemmatimonadota bacterium]